MSDESMTELQNRIEAERRIAALTIIAHELADALGEANTQLIEAEYDESSEVIQRNRNAIRLFYKFTKEGKP